MFDGRNRHEHDEGDENGERERLLALVSDRLIPRRLFQRSMYLSTKPRVYKPLSLSRR